MTIGFIIPIIQILESNSQVENPLPMVFNVGEQVKVLSMMFYSKDAGIKPLLGTSSVAGALFGAIHCLAWHFSFPSHAERIMWRAASLGIVGPCATLFFTSLLWNLDGDAEGIWEVLASLMGAVGLFVSCLAPFIYPVARITLLVLAITSLRFLPPSAFDTVDWVEFVPHI